VNRFMRGASAGLFALAGQFTLAGQFSGVALAGPAVIVTIDVESTASLPLPNQVDASCEEKVPCGLMHIVDMLKERGFAGTFFLNVYEYKAWGASNLRNIALKLQAAGQDVGLHTHPQWAYDPARPDMYSYSAGDQNRIIADGVRLLKAWTGLPVVAHRAGDYSANKDTVEALTRNGIVLDSSLFRGHPHSKLDALALPSNLPSKIGQVVEVPVTVYKRYEHPSLFGSLAPPFIAIGKVDVNSIQSEAEARAAVDALIDADLPIIVVFLHSFSLIEAPLETNYALRSNTLAIGVFGALLDEASKRHLRGTTARELASAKNIISDGRRDVIPEVDIMVPVLEYSVRALRAQSAATKLGIGCSMLLLGLGMSSVFFAIRRRRALRAASNR